MNHDMLQQIDNAVRVYCDGSCLMHHEQRPGGWAYMVLKGNQVLIEKSGGAYPTTNNQMELMAAVEGLAYCKRQGHKDVLLIADSKYVTNGISAWLKGWVKRGWRTADGSPVANRDLWHDVNIYTGELNVRTVWVKGHAGHEYNERVDKAAFIMANEMARESGL